MLEGVLDIKIEINNCIIFLKDAIVKTVDSRTVKSKYIQSAR